FFQAEDGIRDFHVTGVQTCALPILGFSGLSQFGETFGFCFQRLITALTSGFLHGFDRFDRCRVLTFGLTSHETFSGFKTIMLSRSEERRVGKEARSRGPPQPMSERT